MRQDANGNNIVQAMENSSAQLINFSGPIYLSQNSGFRWDYDISHILNYYIQLFVGREVERQYLANFAFQQKPGYLLVKAPPGYGKSALAADFIHRYTAGPQTSGLQLLYYFVRQNEKQNTAHHFLQVINSQLLSLLNLLGGVPSELDSLRIQFSDLWRLANERTSQVAPLLLVIDGLDEMADADVTVATELPTKLQDYVHVVLTSRPNPNPQQQVSVEHPLRQAQILELQPLNLRDVRQAISSSVFFIPLTDDILIRIYNITRGEPIYLRAVLQDVLARGVATLAQFEHESPPGVQRYFQNQLAHLDKLVNRELTWEILGLLSVTIGGITQDELADLLKVVPRHVYSASKPIARFLLGEERQEFMHGLFRTAVEAELHKPRSYYQQKLVQWCKSYQEQQWPDKTPMYILYHYAEHLTAIHDHKSLYALIDKRWMQLKRQQTGAHVSFAQDMEKVINLAAATNAVDWAPLICSCLAYTTVVSYSANVDSQVLRTLVYAGESTKARHYTTLIRDVDKRCIAYRIIAEACIEIGELSRALMVSEEWRQAASNLEDANIELSNNLIKRLYSAQSAVKLAAVGEFDQAVQVAEAIDDKFISTWTRFRIAQNMANLGQQLRAYHLAKLVLKIDSRWSRYRQYDALTFNSILTQAQSVGVFRGKRKTYFLNEKTDALKPEELERWHDADYLEERFQQCLQDAWSDWGGTHYPFANVAVNLINSKNLEGFQYLIAFVHTITAVNEENRILALVDISCTLAANFHIEWSLKVIDKISNEYDRTPPLGAVTEAVILAGDLQQLNLVLQSTWLIKETSERVTALCTIAHTLAIHSHLDKARHIVNIALELSQLTSAFGAIGYEHNKEILQCTLFDMLCDDGKLDRAVALIGSAWNVTTDAYGFNTKAQWLHKVLNIIARSGQYEYLSTIYPLVKNEQARLSEVAESLSRIQNKPLWNENDIKRFRTESVELGDSFEQVEENYSHFTTSRSLLQQMQTNVADKGHKHRHESLVSHLKRERLYRINNRGLVNRVEENERLILVQEGKRFMEQVGSLDGLKEFLSQYRVVGGYGGEYRKIIVGFAYWLADMENIDLLEQALKIIENPHGRLDMISVMADRLAETHNHKSLHRLLTLTQETDLSIAVGFAVGRIGMAMVESGDQEGLRQTLAVAITLNPRNGDRDDALRLIAPALAEVGRFDEAVKIVFQFKVNLGKDSIFEEISIHLISANSIEEAFSKLVSALQVACHFSREGIFQVLNAAQYWFMYIDNGKTAWQIYQAVEEVEKWWSFDKTLEELKSRLRVA